MWLSFAGSVLIACSIIGVEVFKQREKIRDLKEKLDFAKGVIDDFRLFANGDMNEIQKQFDRAEAAENRLAEIKEEAEKVLAAKSEYEAFRFLSRIKG